MTELAQRAVEWDDLVPGTLVLLDGEGREVTHG